MENKLCQIRDDPRKLPFTLIKEITNGLAEERILGRGTFGTVYKGVFEDGEEIAVKILHSMPGLTEKQFENEFENLKKLEHANIVRLVGFCDEMEEAVAWHEGQYVNCVKINRALCLEYVTNGSLGKILSSKRLGRSWHMRYKIIKGICEGLEYLHHGLEDPILHLDLKLDNILLDEEMVPKIADFGLSRLVGEDNTKRTVTPLGTIGYLPPEFITNQVISKEYDVFSLGVIIKKIIAFGIKDFDMDASQLVEHVQENWIRDQREVAWHALLEADCKQVKRCMELALNCMQNDRRKRPTTKDVVRKLDVIEKCHYEESMVLMNRTICYPSQEAVLLAVIKIGSVLEDGTAKAIINRISEKFQALKELPRNVDQIRMKLTFMSDTIKQIGTVCLTDEVVKSWIGEVRKVAYRVEDVMDKYSYHILNLRAEGFLTKYFVKDTHYIIVFHEIVDELAQIEKEIQQVILLKDLWLPPYQLVPDQLAAIERQRSQDSFPEFVKDEDLVGIEGNRQLLTGWLYSEEMDSTVITVSGMGGLGKSMLVTNVYNREKVNFPVHAWIVVSQIYTVDSVFKKILRKIKNITSPQSTAFEEMDLHQLKQEIKQSLQNRTFFIVLDDVWEQLIYCHLHDAFQNLQSSRIIITTRNNHVANIAPSNHHLKLQPLDLPDAFDLFCRRAFHNKKDHKCPKEFQEIASSIVDRCHGLPLAIVTIGSLLSSRPRINMWNQTYNQFRSALSTNDHVRAILNLSYHDLSGDLRNCFLYCSLFPEDYPMSRESLVQLWVAEGFVLSKEKNTPEEVAEGNLMELIHRNMLEVVDYDELGRVSTCKMHDIMRYLALSVAKEKKFGSANDYGELIHVDQDVRRLSLCRWKVNTALKVKFPCLRSLVGVDIISRTPNILSSILSESTYLTVLELQDSDITEVPAFIGNLFNLRYIGLRRTKVKSLPESFEKLSRLQTLDTKETQIEKLPQGIVKVKKLRHLLADRLADEKQSEFQYFIGLKAPKGLPNLEELQTLETVQASKYLAEQLKRLKQLRSLWIDNISGADCEDILVTVSNMPLLSSLLLSAKDENEVLCFDALKPRSTQLHKLIIRGQWAKGTLDDCPIFRGYGMHLKCLALSWCHLWEDPLQMLAPHLPNLTDLRLNNMHSANTLVLPEGSFPHLKLLVLKHMPNVNQLLIGKGALPCIEGLYIVSLAELENVPHGIESLRSLKKLWLVNLHRSFLPQWNKSGMHHKMQHVREIRV